MFGFTCRLGAVVWCRPIGAYFCYAHDTRPYPNAGPEEVANISAVEHNWRSHKTAEFDRGEDANGFGEWFLFAGLPLQEGGRVGA